MNVTVAEGGEILYKCHRAQCGLRGNAGTSTAVELHWPEKRVQNIKPYMGELHPVEDKDVLYFHDRFGLPEHLVRAWIRVNEDDEYVLPIYNRYGQIRGHVERQPVWKGRIQPVRTGRPGQQKARTWKSDGSPTQSWYYPHPGHKALNQAVQVPKVVILVEDQISAMCAASEGYIGLALLGVHLNGDRVREIQQERPDRVVLALDNDAEGIACKLAQKWGVALPGFEMVLLRADLKDMPSVWEEIR
jgi:hypothetical protein